MSIASDVMAIVDGLDYPCAQTTYAGSADAYFVFNANMRPTAFADDEPETEIWSVQLHFFAPYSTNTIQLCRKIRRRISEAGFTYPEQIDASSMQRSDDGTERHIVWEFEGSAPRGDG